MISASEVIESVKNATERAKIIQSRQDKIGGLVSVDMSGVVDVAAKGIAQVFSGYIREYILNPHYSYAQEDGTLAIPQFKFKEMQEIARRSYEEMPEELQLLFVSYAKHVLKILIEEVVENVGIQ